MSCNSFFYLKNSEVPQHIEDGKYWNGMLALIKKKQFAIHFDWLH